MSAKVSHHTCDLHEDIYNLDNLVLEYFANKICRMFLDQRENKKLNKKLFLYIKIWKVLLETSDGLFADSMQNWSVLVSLIISCYSSTIDSKQLSLLLEMVKIQAKELKVADVSDIYKFLHTNIVLSHVTKGRYRMAKSHLQNNNVFCHHLLEKLINSEDEIPKNLMEEDQFKACFKYIQSIYVKIGCNRLSVLMDIFLRETFNIRPNNDKQQQSKEVIKNEGSKLDESFVEDSDTEKDTKTTQCVLPQSLIINQSPNRTEKVIELSYSSSSEPLPNSCALTTCNTLLKKQLDPKPVIETTEDENHAKDIPEKHNDNSATSEYSDENQLKLCHSNKWKKSSKKYRVSHRKRYQKGANLHDITVLSNQDTLMDVMDSNKSLDDSTHQKRNTPDKDATSVLLSSLPGASPYVRRRIKLDKKIKTVEDLPQKYEKINETILNKNNEDTNDKSCDEIDNTATINREGPLDKKRLASLQAKCESDLIKPGIELERNNLESCSPSAEKDSGKIVSFSPNNKKIITRSFKKLTNKKTSYDIINHKKPQDNRNIMETDSSHNLIDFSSPQLKHQADAIKPGNEHDKTNLVIGSPKSIDELSKNENIPVSPNKTNNYAVTESSEGSNDKISTAVKNSTNEKDVATNHRESLSDRNKNSCENKFESPAKTTEPKDNGNLTSTPIERKGPRVKHHNFEVVIDAIRTESSKTNRSLYFGGNNKKHSIINSDDPGTSCVWSDDESEGIHTISRTGSRVAFSKNEESYIIDGVGKFGVGNWAAILKSYKFHPSRTNVSIKDKFRTMKRQGII